MKTIKLVRTYTTTFTFDVDTTAEAMELFDNIPSDEKYNQELEQMNVDEIVDVEEAKFARKCDFTGEGMNCGWCFGDGEMYAKYENDAFDYAKEMGYAGLQSAFDDDAVYWTEWDDESDYQYELINGKLVEIQ